jgi:uncharacterized protein
MQTSDLLLSTYANMLGSLDGWLAKAAEHPRGDTLLADRLAEDMFPLSRQIRFVCNLPGEAMNATSDVAFGSSDIDDETIAAARERIAGTRTLIARWREIALGADDKPVILSLANGMTFDLDTASFARDWALPQFYFHLMTVYAILRAAGVPLGKVDYVGYMLAYMRQPASAAEA